MKIISEAGCACSCMKTGPGRTLFFQSLLRGQMVYRVDNPPPVSYPPDL